MIHALSGWLAPLEIDLEASQRFASTQGSATSGKLSADEQRLIVRSGGAPDLLALFAMLVTYSKSDPSFTHAVSAVRVGNIGGRVGAWVADVTLLLFGLSAYLLVAGLFVWVARGFRVLHRTASGADPLDDELPGWAHALGFVLLFGGALGIESLRLSALTAALPGAPGGVVGGAIARLTQAGLGFTGATVLFLAVFAIGLSLFLDFSWLAVAERLGRFLSGFSRRAEQRREEEEDRAIGEAASKVREAALVEERERIEEAPPVHIERPPANVPLEAQTLFGRTPEVFPRRASGVFIECQHLPGESPESRCTRKPKAACRLTGS